MSLCTRDDIHTRVRRLFLEEAPMQSTDFIARDQLPDEIDDGYDQGCQLQLMTCIDNAEKTGRLEDHDNGFLQNYITRFVYTINRNQSEYTIPSDVLRIIKFSVNGIRGIRIAPDQDRVLRQWPGYFASAKGQVQWALLSGGLESPPVPDTATRFLRVYVYGDTVRERVSVPAFEMRGILVYYRNIVLIANQSPPATYTDVEDPWNEGPCFWSCARILEKAQQGEPADRMYARARERFNAIIPPPMPSGPAPGRTA